ncbi:hypothetical protein tb265_09300 [Gemmatimonadetes bacterium T265]|nr:hypothetical protein tb265_09300 [Gemmatimonadetes bacterium T265]
MSESARLAAPALAAAPPAASPPRPRRLLWRALGPPARLFDAVERAWERPSTQHALGLLLVAAFLAALVTVELGRRGWLPAGLAGRVSRSHFWAVDVAFSLLLFLELVALVLALARSVGASVAKQFELLALILLRKAILEVAHVGEPIAWLGAAPHVPVALADMAGALVVFILAEAHARVQRHRAITSADDQAAFIAAKKLVALALLAALAVGAADAAAHLPVVGQPTFFEVCFTVLIFTDVLLVLLSLAASADHRVVFRNSAYAASTLMIRLALTAPPYLNAAIAVGAAAYAVAVSVAYERARAVPLVGTVAFEPRAGV